MIDALKKDLAAAESARKRLDETVDPSVVGSGSKYLIERRFYDGYITAIKYALVLAKEKAKDEAGNPFSKGVE